MRNIIMLISLSSLLLLTSCDDLFEKKLSGKTVEILAPPNGGILSTSSVTFWWNKVSGATKYNIQIVKPSFSNVQFLVADSFPTGDKFTVALQPGFYQWRIKALNSSSETDFFIFSFSIDSSLDLSNQNVQLLNPTNNRISSLLTQTFTWSPVFYADDYRFEILSSGGGTIYTDAAAINTSVTYTFANDGTYTWRVRAQNSTSVSNYGQAVIFIDNTNPALPNLLSPANNAIVSNPFTLSWNQTTDNGSSIFDSLYIFKDANQDTLYKALRPSASTYTDSLALGDYFWKLTAIDSAGNYSAYTSLYKFIIQ